MFSLTLVKKIYEKSVLNLLMHILKLLMAVLNVLKGKFQKSKNLINLLNHEKKNKIDKFSACLKFKKM